MADNDVWTNIGVIAAPAAGDRIPIATGPNAGGYSLRGSFVWKNAVGKYIHNGASPNYAINFADVNPVRGIIGDIANNGASGLTGAQLSFTQNTINNWVIGQPAGVDAFAIWAGRNAAADGVEIARFTGLGSGNLGIGTTAPVARLHVKSAAEIMRLETTTPRGSGNNYVALADTSGAAGYLGWLSASNHFSILNGLSGHVIIATNGTNRWLFTSSGSFEPDADNTYDIGRAGARVKVVFAATGTINTSDEREKTWRGGLTKAELKAATRIIGELGFYQWNDAVAEKGKDARYHFGARAQRVWQIMADEKLVAPITGTGKNQRPGKTPYAFLCWDEWDEETTPEMVDKVIPAVFEGKGKSRVEVEPERTERVPTGEMLVTVKAGNRFGLRTDQFIMFLVAAQEARLAAVEAFIAKAG